MKPSAESDLPLRLHGNGADWANERLLISGIAKACFPASLNHVLDSPSHSDLYVRALFPCFMVVQDAPANAEDGEISATDSRRTQQQARLMTSGT